jgi:enoyl-CoA hydratase/carnithine racemase
VIDFVAEGSIGIATLDRGPVNGLNDAWVARLHEVLDEAEKSKVNVLHVRSALKVFCGGADLKQIGERFDWPVEEQLKSSRLYQGVFARLEKFPGVTLAEINGAAFGGGLELALACDLRIASTAAKLSLPEVGLGLLPGAGGTQRLTKLCGRAVALRMILGAEVVDGQEAFARGIVQWLGQPENLAAEASKIANRYSRMPRLAVAAAKAAILAAHEPGVDGFEMETIGLRDLFASAETKALVAAFLANQKAK